MSEGVGGGPHSDPAEEPLEPISPADLQALTRTPEIDGPYTLGPDSTAQEGVPRGQVSQHHWTSTAIYPGVERDYWVYVPQQYDGSRPACLMVFQDAQHYLGPDANVPIAFDNLIHQGDMPLTIGLFVSPGDRGPGTPRWGGADNRSLEYDSLGDRYARFLLEELLPPLEQQYNLVADPEGRAICGISSGGICAFTVAWERPDAFRKVVSHCGSFTNLRGGNQYPSLIRRSAPRPLRVFLQTGTQDLDVVFGNWVIANQDMAAALAYRGYDYQFVLGEGGHSLTHGGAIFPDTMRWLWRDYPHE
ncbi:MAG TPA: alpha/beta hydrolase-fold protein [Herpetosiphonaceae bacterium]